jgi:hypothetical protein
MKSDKLFIRFVKSAAIILVITIISLEVSHILDLPHRWYRFNFLIFEISYLLGYVLFGVAFLGGIQILVLVKRYQRKLRKIKNITIHGKVL